MPITPVAPEDIVEAVIISGARKGELIRLPTRETDVTPAEEALIDGLNQAGRRLAESARLAADEADALLADLRAARAR